MEDGQSEVLAGALMAGNWDNELMSARQRTRNFYAGTEYAFLIIALGAG